MLNESARTIRQTRLNDGRVLAFAEHGYPAGEPVLFFHGTPGSRLFCHPDRSIAMSLGARIITIDRPGFGLSDFKPGRALLDWPNDVLQLADALDIDRFAVAGISGGAPYAAACAAKIPERLTGAAMISSLGPVAGDTVRGMAWHLRLVLGLAQNSYALTRLSWWLANLVRSRNAEWFCEFEADSLPTSERELLRNAEVRRMLVRDHAEALRHGARGTAWDMTLLARPWGFRLEDIRSMVWLWHGEDDVRTPLAMARHLASAIPNCRQTHFPGEGHDVFYHHWRAILACLLRVRLTQEAARLTTGNGKPARRHSRRPAATRPPAISEEQPAVVRDRPVGQVGDRLRKDTEEVLR